MVGMLLSVFNHTSKHLLLATVEIGQCSRVAISIAIFSGYNQVSHPCGIPLSLLAQANEQIPSVLLQEP